MKKFKIVFYLLLSVVLFSCTPKEQAEYHDVYWKEKTKRLKLETLQKIIEVQSYAELHKTVLMLDSMKQDYR